MNCNRQKRQNPNFTQLSYMENKRLLDRVHTSISSLLHLAALSASSSYFILHSADSSSASLLARSNCLLQEFQCI
uniref:Uncharacterized protein n=2 Tax=Rhizophora mucronata TaxID=61149 RepID=A0A2P2LCD3_RHIMU